jgi:purine-binding chemotaxis protein CheW
MTPIELPDAPAAPDASDPAEGAAGGRLLLFGVRGRVYGCHIGAVREIVPVRHPTRLPGAPSYVAGIINLRGTVITVLDLGQRLVSEAVDQNVGSIVIVEHGPKVVGLCVDDVRDVQALDGAQLDPVNGADDRAAGLVLGVGRVGGGVVVVLDVQALVGQVLL